MSDRRKHDESRLVAFARKLTTLHRLRSGPVNQTYGHLRYEMPELTEEQLRRLPAAHASSA